MPVSTSAPHMGTSCTPLVPAGHHLSPYLDGNCCLFSRLFKIKMTFRVHPRLAVKCVMLASQRAASKGPWYRCSPWPAISLPSQGYSGGVRDRAVHALLPLKSHLNNHGEGKQQHSANSCVGDVFIFCSERCMVRTASAGVCGSPLAAQAFCMRAKLQMWGDASAQDQVPQVLNYGRHLVLTAFTSCRQCQVDCLSWLLCDTPVLMGAAGGTCMEKEVLALYYFGKLLPRNGSSA